MQNHDDKTPWASSPHHWRPVRITHGSSGFVVQVVRHKVYPMNMERISLGFVSMWTIYSYCSGLLHWYWGNHDCPSTNEVTLSNRLDIKSAITWSRQNSTNRERCAYFLGCIVMHCINFILMIQSLSSNSTVIGEIRIFHHHKAPI